MSERYIVLLDGYPQGRFELYEDAIRCAESFFKGTMPVMNQKPVEICYVLNTFENDGEMKAFRD